MKKPKTPKSAPAPQPDPDIERIRLVIAHVYILDACDGVGIELHCQLWNRLVNDRPRFLPGDYAKLFPGMPRPGLDLDNSEPVSA